MKKRFLFGSAVALGVLGFSLCTINANAISNDVVTKDNFVFDANNLAYQNYNAGATVANTKKVSVKLGNEYTGQTLNANFDFGDYSFQYGLLAEEANLDGWTKLFRQFDSNYKSNQNLAQYYISAEEGTKCGVYYTLVDKQAVNNTYYVSNNNTVKVIQEKKNNKYTVAESFTEDLDYMYYSEFTFGNQKTLGLMSETQYIVLFGVTVVTNTEITNRATTNAAIENLINYYNENGVSTSDEFEELIEAAQTSLNGVNHISQITNYSQYQEILAKHDELVNLEAKINLLRNTNNESGYARAFALDVKYDAETKALLDDIASTILSSNISPASISNYYLYQMALDMYNQLEEDYNNSQVVVNLISNLGEVEYTDEYKTQLDTIDNLLNTISNQSYVSNIDEFFAKYDEFNTISNENVNAFINKVNEVNEVKGETTSYTLINEAEELYNALINADKTNDAVVEALNVLEAAKAAYDEYESSVAINDFVYGHNEDGSIKKAIFIGTINEFTSCSDISSIMIYIDNLTTGEVQAVEAGLVYTSFKVNGELVKVKADGVRYIYTVISNVDGEYKDNTVSVYFTINYKDGHVVTSDATTIEF